MKRKLFALLLLLLISLAACGSNGIPKGGPVLPPNPVLGQGSQSPSPAHGFIPAGLEAPRLPAAPLLGPGAAFGGVSARSAMIGVVTGASGL